MAQVPNAWINEFSPGTAEITGSSRVEVVVDNPGSLDLSSLVLTLYNGEGEPIAGAHDLTSFEQGESAGRFHFYHKEVAGTAALSLDYQGTLIQFVSNREELQAVSGPAEGIQAEYTGIQLLNPSQGTSLQLRGAGEVRERFNWNLSETGSFGTLNEDQYLHTVVQFSRPTLTVQEGADVLIPVTINGPDGNRVVVQVSLQQMEGYADASDFLGGSSGTVTFFEDAADGETQNISLTLNDDEIYEGEESAIFRLTILSAGGSALPGNVDSLELIILDNDRPDVVINEILADPEGDIDGNGSTDDVYDDQFIELLNNESENVDIGGWTFSDNGNDIRYTFPPGTIIPASGGLVLFSRDADGSPSGLFGGSPVHISDVPLELGRTGDTPTLRDRNGVEIDRYRYAAEANRGQSLVRDPDGSGLFRLHGEVGPAAFSPGTRTDGTNFTNSVIISGQPGWRLLSAPASELSVNQLGPQVSVRGYPGYAPGQSKSFFTGYDGSSFTDAETVDNNSLTPGRGFLLYFFAPSGSAEPSLAAKLDATSGVPLETDVNVGLHSDGDNWNLLGNPFDTALDLSDISSWINGNGTLQSSVGQFWDDESNSFILTTINNNLVPSWHGFFIKNEDAGELTIPFSARSDRSAFGGNPSRQGYLAFTLQGEDNSSGAVSSDRAAVIYFHEEAEHGWDLFDAEKLVPFANRYALLSFRGQGPEGEDYVSKAQDARPFELQDGLSYSMDVTTSNMSGQFVLSWQREELPDTWRFTLIDNQTGTQVDMSSAESYTFTHESDNSSSSNTIQAAEEAPGNTLPATLVLDTTTATPSRFTIRVSAGSEGSGADETVESAKLNPNYPNPFNPTTVISFELTEPAEVHLNIYTIVGQRVATLVDGMREAGTHEVVWSAPELPSGIYIAQLEAAGKVFIRKMTLIK